MPLPSGNWNQSSKKYSRGRPVPNVLSPASDMVCEVRWVVLMSAILLLQFLEIGQMAKSEERLAYKSHFWGKRQAKSDSNLQQRGASVYQQNTWRAKTSLLKGTGKKKEEEAWPETWSLQLEVFFPSDDFAVKSTNDDGRVTYKHM